MLTVTVPSTEQYDELKNEFVSSREQTLQLEHSLVSLSKWESKWQKSWIETKEKTVEEGIDYIRCMTLNKGVDPDVYKFITPDIIDQINKYIESPMTATIINDRKKGRGKSETLTSELIYYYMIALNIPFECQKWHLNRLITLIKVCNIKGQSPQKMSKREIMSQNAALNAARRKQLNTRG